MTAAEKTRLLAERVMGWEARVTDEGRDVAVLRENGYEVLMYLGLIGSPGNSWFPLDNLAHAGVVLEAMRKKGWHADMGTVDQGYCFTFSHDDAAYPYAFRSFAPTLPTAICHAALLAHEVKEEEL